MKPIHAQLLLQTGASIWPHCSGSMILLLTSNYYRHLQYVQLSLSALVRCGIALKQGDSFALCKGHSFRWTKILYDMSVNLYFPT
jgi:uncharacterized membrane protein